MVSSGILLSFCTVVHNIQEFRQKYWATRSSVRSFACIARLFAYTAHSFVPLFQPTCFSGALCSTHSFARLLAYFAHSLARGKVNDWMTTLSVSFLLSTIVDSSFCFDSSPFSRILLLWVGEGGKSTEIERRGAANGIPAAQEEIASSALPTEAASTNAGAPLDASAAGLSKSVDNLGENECCRPRSR